MSFEISHLIICPQCHNPLPACSKWPEEGLKCQGCHSSYQTVRGVPRFVRNGNYGDSFGFEWNRHRFTQLDTDSSDESASTFQRKTGLGPEDVKGKLVLDVGCGMGRFADVVSRWGGNVVAFDLSNAVEAAYQNLGHRDNVVILQADVFEMPFQEESFDIIYSIGVLHHTPDCEKAFAQLPRFLKPNGKIAIWVYGPHSTKRLASLYRRLTVRMPHRLLHALCYLSIPMYPIYKIPLLGDFLWILLPMSRHPKPAWRVLNTFDWYSPKYQSMHTYPEVYRWFRSSGLTDIELLNIPVAVSGVRPSSHHVRPSISHQL